MLVRSISGGGGTPITSYTGTRLTSSSGTVTMTDLDTSKIYIILVWGASSAAQQYNRFDGCTVDNGTLTKIDTMYGSNISGVSGTYFYLAPTSSSVTLTTPSIPSFVAELITPN